MGNSGSAAGKSMMPGAAVLKLGTENVVSEKPPPPDEDLKESLKDVGVDAAGMSAQGSHFMSLRLHLPELNGLPYYFFVVLCLLRTKYERRRLFLKISSYPCGSRA